MNSFQCREPGLSDNRLCSDTIVSILWSVCIILPSLARRLVASNKLLVYQVSSFWIFLRACTNFQMTRLSICSSDQILRLAASAELLVLASWLRTRSIHVPKNNGKQRRSPSWTVSVYVSYVIILKPPENGLQLIRNFLCKHINSTSKSCGSTKARLAIIRAASEKSASVL